MKHRKQQNTPRLLTLFHFTCHWHLDAIRREGILRGDVPITPNSGFNAPSFTTNPDPADQDWAGYPGERIPLPADEPILFFPDKRAIRITVRIPENHPRLFRWVQLVRKYEIDPVWEKALNPNGHGRDWYFFLGSIPPVKFDKIEILQEPLPHELSIISYRAQGKVQYQPFMELQQEPVTIP